MEYDRDIFEDLRNGFNMKCRLFQNYFFWIKPKHRVNLRKYGS